MQPRHRSPKGVRILGSIVTVVVIAAVIGAIVLMGSPGHQRKRKLDDRRVQDLSDIEQAVDTYWQRHKALPQDLLTLSREPGYKVLRTDPENGKPYEYTVTGSESFRLCADFSFDSAEESTASYYRSNGAWAHGAGRHCFDLTIDRSERDK